MISILHVLCEGYTEERFVKIVLKPYFMTRNIAVKHQLLVTNIKKNARGGMISYKQAKRDLSIWMRKVLDNENEKHCFTTMFDLYALPSDFPAKTDADKLSNVYQSVEKIEDAMAADINSKRFIPYIQLHEFEALVFCGLDYLLNDYPDCTKSINALKTELAIKYSGNPEMVNGGFDTAPSKRIITAIEKKYQYNKPISGANVAKAVGIESLRKRCAHFDNWIKRLDYALDVKVV